ncbi:hypothetical protein KHF85_19590 [Xanthomonas translucens pv. graminis]|uniref:hypothetical protein n=1 Tax=Xanthomonas graminis TaxID=3390026 RepID=UPI0025403F4D|nr:hypothetical protein [Xanthomonas translucens]WIH04917.1 hypothetical protein KHF85_19590 [Xanthomonas translucens pv. graminis]
MHLWILWVALLVFLIALLIFGSISPKVLSGSYAVLVLCGLAVLGTLRRIRILRAIKVVNNAVEAEITYVPLLKARGVNTMREGDWLFRAGSTGDANLDRLKSDMKRFLIFGVVAFLSIPVISVIGALI